MSSNKLYESWIRCSEANRMYSASRRGLHQRQQGCFPDGAGKVSLTETRASLITGLVQVDQDDRLLCLMNAILQFKVSEK